MRRLPIPVLLLAAGIAAALPGCAQWKATLLYKKGTEAMEHKQTAKAIADLERAAELWPDSGDIQNHLGIAYLEAGRRRDARDAFARSVALDCSNPAAQHNLELLQAELGP